MAIGPANAQDKKVRECLEDWGIDVIFTFKPQNESEAEKKVKEAKSVSVLMFDWIVIIKGETFEYSEGLGHQKLTAKLSSQRHLCINDYNSIIACICGKNRFFNLKKPEPAAVLYCLLLDSEALPMTFQDWCWSFGYSDDSRKAEETYNACCEYGRKLHKIFTHEQIETLRKILEDY